MVTAFLLVNTEIGSEKKVLRALKAINAMEEIYLVYGVYDIVAKIKAENMKQLKEVITSRLIRSNDIKTSTTMIVIPEKQSLKASSEKAPTIII